MILSISEHCPDGSAYTTLTSASDLFDVSNAHNPDDDVSSVVYGSGSFLSINSSIVLRVRPNGNTLQPPLTVMTLTMTVFDIQIVTATFYDESGTNLHSALVSTKFDCLS